MTPGQQETKATIARVRMGKARGAEDVKVAPAELSRHTVETHGRKRRVEFEGLDSEEPTEARNKRRREEERSSRNLKCQALDKFDDEGDILYRLFQSRNNVFRKVLTGDSSNPEVSESEDTEIEAIEAGVSVDISEISEISEPNAPASSNGDILCTVLKILFQSKNDIVKSLFQSRNDDFRTVLTDETSDLAEVSEMKRQAMEEFGKEGERLCTVFSSLFQPNNEVVMSLFQSRNDVFRKILTDEPAELERIENQLATELEQKEELATDLCKTKSELAKTKNENDELKNVVAETISAKIQLESANHDMHEKLETTKKQLLNALLDSSKNKKKINQQKEKLLKVEEILWGQDRNEDLDEKLRGLFGEMWDDLHK